MDAVSQECIACQNTSPIDNFPASFVSSNGYGDICFDCIKINPMVEICHRVCRRCHMLGGTTFTTENRKCNRCAHDGKIKMKRFHYGGLTTNETVIAYPYTRLAQKSFNEYLRNGEYLEILSIDQEIINNM